MVEIINYQDENRKYFKTPAVLLLFFLLVGFANLAQAQKPCVAFSFDDGNPGEDGEYEEEEMDKLGL